MSKEFQKEFIQIVTNKFPVQPGEDDEIVNDGLYGHALSAYLQKEMANIGYESSYYGAEDWGWWVSVKKEKFNSGISIYCTSEPPELKTYAVCDAEHSFTKWSWSKFRKVSRREETLKLRANLLAIFENDPDIHVKGISEDPWE